MAEKKSKKYDSSGEDVNYAFVDDKLTGLFIKSTSTNSLVPENNKSFKFSTLINNSDALDAFRKAVYGPNKEAYPDEIDYASDEEMSDYYAKSLKKSNNEQFVDQSLPTNIAFSSAATLNTSGRSRGGTGDKKLMRYPFDIDLSQDHFKITRYNYVRPNLNLSKSAGRTFNRVNSKRLTRTGGGQPIDGTVAGDSVVGSDLKGTILLPMPKVTDVNGVEWGKSELNSSGLVALNATNALTLGGTLSGKDEGDRLNDKAIREAIASRNEERSSTEGAAALYTGTIAKLAGTLTGSDLDADTFLARQGGKVLNPNAEMLFQGPVIRDFGFSFVMIARSENEGAEIRSIIKFLKDGMAPKFRSTTFLENPDIFTLEYKSGNEILKTVNRFSPGGLALTTMRVDYAPNGYWSAYRDSQPVAIKMDLDFTELRPIYQGDQLNTPTDSVGY
tara:strand:- start:718 stop:2052 length:1335 start_codon:yes stop_codon:yes gene_type:complete